MGVGAVGAEVRVEAQPEVEVEVEVDVEDVPAHGEGVVIVIIEDEMTGFMDRLIIGLLVALTARVPTRGGDRTRDRAHIHEIAAALNDHLITTTLDAIELHMNYFVAFLLKVSFSPINCPFCVL